jgi:hypothetical protein
MEERPQDTAKPPDAVPTDLAGRLSSSISDARVLLGVMRSIRGPSEAKTAVGAQLYRVTASKFKRVASELTHRFDTMSSFLDASVLESFAASRGCRWDPSSRRLIVLPSDSATA